MQAVFDQNDHAVEAGWATYHKHLTGWRRLICAVIGHFLGPAPAVPNGYSPSNYARCKRCDSSAKWFRLGQHRYGSLDRLSR